MKDGVGLGSCHHRGGTLTNNRRTWLTKIEKLKVDTNKIL